MTRGLILDVIEVFNIFEKFECVEIANFHKSANLYFLTCKYILLN